MSALSIRPMVATDIEGVVHIEQESFTTGWSLRAYLTELANPSAYYLVAERDGRVIGYGGVWLVMDELHVTAIAVEKAARGQKIGERLLIALLIEAIRRGARQATLEVRTSNAAAKGLYVKYGFVWAGIRKGYYSDNGEDADILWIYDLESEKWRTLFDRNRTALEDS
jgi:ribosomal-protein-alanine N-acetyltransferase